MAKRAHESGSGVQRDGRWEGGEMEEGRGGRERGGKSKESGGKGIAMQISEILSTCSASKSPILNDSFLHVCTGHVAQDMELYHHISAQLPVHYQGSRTALRKCAQCELRAPDAPIGGLSSTSSGAEKSMLCGARREKRRERAKVANDGEDVRVVGGKEGMVGGRE